MMVLVVLMVVGHEVAGPLLAGDIALKGAGHRVEGVPRGVGHRVSLRTQVAESHRRQG